MLRPELDKWAQLASDRHGIVAALRLAEAHGKSPTIFHAACHSSKWKAGALILEDSRRNGSAFAIHGPVWRSYATLPKAKDAKPGYYTGLRVFSPNLDVIDKGPAREPIPLFPRENFVWATFRQLQSVKPDFPLCPRSFASDAAYPG